MMRFFLQILKRSTLRVFLLGIFSVSHAQVQPLPPAAPPPGPALVPPGGGNISALPNLMMGAPQIYPQGLGEMPPNAGNVIACNVMRGDSTNQFNFSAPPGAFGSQGPASGTGSH